MRLNVAYACGEEYARHAGVSMISLFENNKEFQEIYVYLIDNGMTEKTKNILLNIAKQYNRDITLILCDKLCNNLKADNRNGRYTLATYSKIFFGQFEEIDKIIYFDCDTSITGSLVQLWNKDISEYYVAGVWDDAAPRLKSSVGIKNNDIYINTGFVLINLVNWRKFELEKKAIEFINKYDGKVPFLDQGVINAICKNHILLLEPKYDLMSYMLMFRAKEIEALCRVDKMYFQEEIDDAIKNPIVIHWVTGYYNRPWSKNCTHPLKDRYFKYLEMSPWAGQFINTNLSNKTRILRFIYRILPFFVFSMLRNLSDKIKERYDGK